MRRRALLLATTVDASVLPSELERECRNKPNSQRSRLWFIQVEGRGRSSVDMPRARRNPRAMKWRGAGVVAGSRHPNRAAVALRLAVAVAALDATACRPPSVVLSRADQQRLEGALRASAPLQIIRRVRRLMQTSPLRVDSLELSADLEAGAAGTESARTDAAAAWVGSFAVELAAERPGVTLESASLVRSPFATTVGAVQSWGGVPVINRGVAVQVSAGRVAVTGRLLVEAPSNGESIGDARAQEIAIAAVRQRLAIRDPGGVTAARVVVPADEIAGATGARRAWWVGLLPPHHAQIVVLVDATTGDVLRFEDTARAKE